MNKWNLNELYQSLDDPTYKEDIQLLTNQLELFKTFYTLECTTKHVEDYLHALNDFQDRCEKLYCFLSLQQSADTSNVDVLKQMDQFSVLLASSSDTFAKNDKWLASYDDTNTSSETIKEHQYLLSSTKKNIQYLLDDQSEVVLASMKNTGSIAWSKYKDQLISNHTITIDHKEYPLTEVLNMAYSPDASIRKNAYLKEIESYKSIELGVASALNAIKGESLSECQMRGYESVLDRTIITSRMSKKTLDALLNTIKKSLPLFEQFYQTKAKFLGHTNGLPWYDLYAPVIQVENRYEYPEGANFVVDKFSTFSKNLGDYARKAIDQQWIDVFPRKNKVGGAFCCNLHSLKQSRFLLNYGNEFSDVTTLAHELGHGFHGHCLNEQTALNSNYPMPIAETASTFCETIVKKAAMQDASLEQKVLLLENELTDCGQVIVDIYSRFLFESRILEKRKEGPLGADEFSQLMVEAQKEAYGNGLDPNYLHPYMWTWKPHYYESDYAFYNFPYAFGLLLAKGLYGMYRKIGPSFASTYETFFSLTGKMDLEEVGASVGIDLQDEAFWQNSIDMIKEDLDLFYQYLQQLS